MSWTPHDLPHIIEKAHTTYQHILHTYQSTPGFTEHPDYRWVTASCSRSIHALDSPDLHWIDRDACELVASTLETLPDWSPSACLPAQSGIIALEKPFFTVPYENAHADDLEQVRVYAISWHTHDGDLRIATWAIADSIPAHARSPLRHGLPLEELAGVTMPIDEDVAAAEVRLGASVITPTEDYTQAAKTMTAVAGAVWLLMAQPRILADAPTVARVRKSRGGQTYRMPVSVSVRSLTTRTQARPGAKGTGTKATTRWWVRGHWRQQPWGKNRALRKPVYIAPHTAGAQDAKPEGRPSVQVWRE